MPLNVPSNLDTKRSFRLLGIAALSALAPALAAPAAHAATAAPKLVLMDASADKQIPEFSPLATGDALNLPSLPSTKLSVRAMPDASAASVGFVLDGTLVRTENQAPYSIAGDNSNGDYYAWTPKVGKHVLKVTSYSQKDRAGTASATNTINFTVTDDATKPSLVLVNADTNNAITGFAPIDSGAKLDLAKLPTRKLSVKANIPSTAIKSVGFTLDGKLIKTENQAPFSIAGDDSKGDYYAWTPKVGKHTLKVQGYTQTGLKGTAGAATTLAFTVSDSGTASAPVVTTPTATTPVVTPPVDTTPAPPVDTTPAPPVETTPDPAPAPDVDLAQQPFAATSPWKAPISDTARFGDGSDARASQIRSLGSYINSANGYGITVTQAQSGDPVWHVRDRNTGAITNLQVPANALPEAGTDGNMTIIDPTKSFEDEFWQIQPDPNYPNESPRTHWINGTHGHDDLTGNGVGHGVRAAKFSQLGGLIRKSDLDRGSIDHALVVVLPNLVMLSGYKAPAVQEDGYANLYGCLATTSSWWNMSGCGSHTGSIRMGQRFALPRDLDVNALGLSSAGLMLAKSLQTYGILVGDTNVPSMSSGGNAQLQSEPLVEQQNNAQYQGLLTAWKGLEDKLVPVD